MNISVTHSWLKDFLTTNASPQQIADCLSLCGPSVEKLTKTKDDYLYELELTTNRVDMLSVLGIARETAAILPQFGFSARLKNNIYQSARPTGSDPVGKPFPLKVIIDPKLCYRFTAVVIKNVVVKSSPKKIQTRLASSGIRSLNNVIDISNYLMRAFGQPVHVFDLDKIKSKMVLRASKSKETITTLDEKTHILPGNDIVIEDGSKKLIDLCGIMGGLNSAVDAKTKNVLLFVQTYNPVNIRQTSMNLAHRTEAAVIFEKSPDPELVMPVLLQGIQLFKALTNGQQGSKIIDIYPHPSKPKVVITPLQLIKERLGIAIPTKTIINILNSLGIDCKLKIENSKISATVPSWRTQDINIPEDIIEELARIYGYHRLPSQIMATAIPTNYPDENFHLEHQIKLWLVGLGLNEIYTNSLVGQNRPGQLKIKNALSADWQYLRNSLVPSHTQSFPAFEIANTYHPRPGKLPEEKLQLIISGVNDFPRLKGIIDVLAAKLHLPLSPHYNHGTAVLDLSMVLKNAHAYPNFQPVSSHPPLIEDLTFTLPPKTYLGPVINAIKSTHRLIKSVQLTKTYQQNYTFTIIYQSMSKDLSAINIAPIRQKIVNLLKTKFEADLVGELR